MERVGLLGQRGCIPSIASVYWVRSFVPIEKNCTRLASSGAIATADGISIMIPVSIGSAPTCPRARSAYSSACSRSSSRAIIGNMTETAAEP